MFDAFSTLLFMCTAMFFGALGVGYVPLACNLSPERLRAWTALGAGLLIGTALIVIIPEGVAMWYGAAAGAHAAAHEEGASSSGGGTAPHGHETRAAAPVQAHSHGHGVVGACLVAGYALMLLVDRVSKGHAHAHGHGGDAGDSHAHGAGVPGREDGSPFMKQDGATAARVAAYARDGAGGLERHGDSEAPGGVAAAAVDAKKGDSALLGMVVHALSDGVALGAASMSPSSALNWLVFVAIMLHKGPSALGLTVYLMHINLSKDEVGALMTHFFLGLTALASSPAWLGKLLLFSGGTFLYVATSHILPELQTDPSLAHLSVPARLTRVEFGALLAGLLLPLMIGVDHGH